MAGQRSASPKYHPQARYYPPTAPLNSPPMHKSVPTPGDSYHQMTVFPLPGG